jgi:hypothetical protein
VNQTLDSHGTWANTSLVNGWTAAELNQASYNGTAYNVDDGETNSYTDQSLSYTTQSFSGATTTQSGQFITSGVGTAHQFSSDTYGYSNSYSYAYDISASDPDASFGVFSGVTEYFGRGNTVMQSSSGSQTLSADISSEWTLQPGNTWNAYDTKETDTGISTALASDTDYYNEDWELSNDGGASLTELYTESGSLTGSTASSYGYSNQVEKSLNPSGTLSVSGSGADHGTAAGTQTDAWVDERENGVTTQFPKPS